MCTVARSSVAWGAVTNSAARLIASNANRTALVLSPAATITVTLSDSPNVAANAGLILHPAGNPIKLCVHSAGDWIRRDLYAIGSAAGPENVSWIDVEEGKTNGTQR
jgi:hypothetical protein